ncbi:MAG: dicarboxylate/amino acid:cation symporter [Deltaproteobacteria bacterium]|nr:dicarboxylate/amino acid:cation symporter [Deltaproteobacteria bacterium]
MSIPTSDPQRTDSRRRHTLFLIAIVAAMLLGAVVGGFAKTEIPVIALLGDLFLNALKMMIVPLIVSSIINGVTSLGDIRKLGRMGALTAGFYLTTTILAVTIGMIVVNVIQPGVGVAVTAHIAPAVGEYSFLDVVRAMVPANLFAAMASGDILPLIFFSLFFGIVMSTLGEKIQPLQDAVDGLFLVSMKMVHIIILTAPIGVFALVATRVGAAGGFDAFGRELAAIGRYVITVMAGLMIHAMVILGLLAWFGSRLNPGKVVRQLAEPLLLAFSTASSSATLPVTMKTVQENLNVDKRVSSFVLPLGATVNMDGTALYEAVAAMFVAQCYGIDLSFSAQLLIVLTATLAAIGAAGIPQAGLVTLVMVLQTAGLPAEGIGMILAVDWFLDRCRTTVNVFGDAVGTLVIQRLLQKYLI